MNPLRKPFQYSFFRAAFALVIINTAVHFLFTFLSVNKNFFGLSVIGFVYGHYFWQLVTYMFVHGDISHLFFNMLALLIFGTAIEKALGSKEFLLMYFVIGVCSGLFSLGMYYAFGKFLMMNGIQPWTFAISLIGASGAIYGLLFAYAVLFPRSIIYIWGLLPVPAPLMVLGYGVIEFVSQFVSSSNVAHMTHLAGFAFAWLYFIARMGVHPIQVWKNAYRR
ncbi:MAG: rhomboid family intramembrane serine protease [Treponema sp.]|uniref:rhomboid family intramembrane serine protease n=1 Tax=Treponema sp. TaxID=166 RepID=UPI0025DC360E|nr:rhomboid family intramembrane serine protease [Treponema sp.]MBQ9280640.1 rhomboid family intramembrane serine protease [Treponema sp.]